MQPTLLSRLALSGRGPENLGAHSRPHILRKVDDGPDLYSLGGGPNPCALRAIQHFEVDGVPVTPLYRVTWRYSGVSVEAQ